MRLFRRALESGTESRHEDSASFAAVSDGDINPDKTMGLDSFRALKVRLLQLAALAHLLLQRIPKKGSIGK